MYRVIVLLLIVFTVSTAFADTKMDITGTLEWDAMQITAIVSLDLASSGIKLPAGRIQGESLLNESCLKLIQPGILDLQVDSSSTISDIIDKGEFSLPEIEALVLNAISPPPSLSPDMLKMTTSYTIPLSGVSSVILRHSRPKQVARTLTPVSAAQYTGIVIIASESLPVYGMRNTAIAVPCLFPKIWDSEMNLIYERNMLESRNISMAHYSPLQGVFQKNPSGLSAELQAVVGEKPLKIFASGVFGIKPTDLIIDKNDAILIISSEENRRLLSQGKVAIILDESVLKQEFVSK
ncbi:MAG: polymerase [Treponema sp.]|jgi:hypothetical protein|nr:polymerase [Treponema sp.]